jgi:hypothetical protein
MKTKLALLCALIFACSARAIVVTFGPQTTDTFLEITVDISDGYWIDYETSERRWVTTGSFSVENGDWLVGSSCSWSNNGTFCVANAELFHGYQWPATLFYYTNEQGHHPQFGLATDEGRKFLQGGNWPGSIPTAEILSPMSARITWDVAPAHRERVPDGGSTIILIAATLLLFSKKRF